MMLLDPKDYTLPVRCYACLGTGRGRLLYKENDQFRLSTCLCARCDGHGVYDALGEKEWETIQCVPRPGTFAIDENLFDSWTSITKKMNKKKTSDSHWLFDLSWY